jgi:hypothetical protein
MYNLRYKVLTAVTTKITIFWNVTTCNLTEVHHHFRGMYCLHHQDKRESQSSKQSEPCIEETGMDTGWDKRPEQTTRNKKKNELVVALKGPVFIPRERWEMEQKPYRADGCLEKGSVHSLKKAVWT